MPCRFHRWGPNSLNDSHFEQSADSAAFVSMPVVRHGWVTINEGTTHDSLVEQRRKKTEENDLGERAAVWKPNGQMRIVDGPSRFIVFGSKIQKLTSYVARLK